MYELSHKETPHSIVDMYHTPRIVIIVVSTLSFSRGRSSSLTNSVAFMLDAVDYALMIVALVLSVERMATFCHATGTTNG